VNDPNEEMRDVGTRLADTAEAKRERFAAATEARLSDPAAAAKQTVEDYKQKQEEKKPTKPKRKRGPKKGKRAKRTRPSHTKDTGVLIERVEALRDQAKDNLERIEKALNDLRKAV